jgi:hypothetical protein
MTVGSAGPERSQYIDGLDRLPTSGDEIDADCGGFTL